MRVIASIALAAMFAGGVLPSACERKIGEDENGNPTGPQSAYVPPPPPPPVTGAPLSDFLPDGGDDTVEKAKQYEANGQLWLARLMMEPRANADDAKPEDIAMLARICDKQGDDNCVRTQNLRLPKNMQIPIKSRDGGRGAAPIASSPRPDDNTDFAKAQKLMLGGKNKEARALLEPKVLAGNASRDEIGLLREVCKVQADKMCVALCTSKLN